jgi:hypothetical protein
LHYDEGHIADGPHGESVIFQTLAGIYYITERITQEIVWASLAKITFEQVNLD